LPMSVIEVAIGQEAKLPLEWNIRIPLLQHRLLRQQFALAIGLPFGLLLGFMLAYRAYYAVMLVALTLLLTAAVVRVVTGGAYDVHYVIDEQGILCENQPVQAKRIRRLAALTAVLGLVSRRPAAAGAGVLAGARIRVFISWQRLRKYKANTKAGYVQVFGGLGENIVLFCPEENYDDVLALIKAKARGKDKRGSSVRPAGKRQP